MLSCAQFSKGTAQFPAVTASGLNPRSSSVTVIKGVRGFSSMYTG